MLLLRFPQWPHEQVRALAASVLEQARAVESQLLLSGDVEGAFLLGQGVGVQLKSTQLDMPERPLPVSQWVGASCHHARDLERAGQIADFASLSPVATTSSHPDADALGWEAFAQLVDQSVVPVYALGGMTSDQLDTARRAGGQGVAGIRGFW